MSIKWEKLEIPPEIDPYIYWSLGPGRPYFLADQERPEYVTAILQLLGETAAKFLQTYQDKGDPPALFASPIYVEPSRLLGETDYFVVVVETDFFEFLASDPQLSSMARPVVMGPPLPAGSICTGASEPVPVVPTGGQAAGVAVVGVIDDGIAFANRRFQTADHGTRVEYAWIQDGECIGPNSPVRYGHEFRKDDKGDVKGIDTLIAECSSGRFFDEEQFYRLTGQADFSRPIHKSVARRASHGTHVMDAAAGYDPMQNRCDRPIICVQLPSTATADTSGARFDPYVMDAVRYIIDRADQYADQIGAGPLPIVINFSYGITAGPHDGTSPLEAELDGLISTRSVHAPLEIVLPAGNSHLTRAHEKVRFAAQNDSQPMHWRVLPDDRTSSFAEIWMPFRPVEPPPQVALPSRMQVTLAFPGDRPAVSPPLDETPNTGWIGTVNGDPVCLIYYRLEPMPTARGRFFVALLPTAFLDPPTALAPSGLWTINLINQMLSKDEPVEAWIQRDDTPFGYPRRGRQSFFDERCYQRFTINGQILQADDPNCIVRRDGCINAIATGHETVVIGGIQKKEMEMAPYSAGGPVTGTRDQAPDHYRPDAVTVSDDSDIFTGILAAGSRSGSTVSLHGTSVAAPQITRWIAKRLAAQLTGGRKDVQALAASSELGFPPQTPAKPPQIRGGEGRIIRPPIVPLRRYD